MYTELCNKQPLQQFSTSTWQTIPLAQLDPHKKNFHPSLTCLYLTLKINTESTRRHYQCPRSRVTLRYWTTVWAPVPCTRALEQYVIRKSGFSFFTPISINKIQQYFKSLTTWHYSFRHWCRFSLSVCSCSSHFLPNWKKQHKRRWVAPR